MQMCGLDDKMREEKRNKRDAVKRENRMGCCCNDTHSLIWIYRQLYFIVCILECGINIECGIKSSDAKGTGWWCGRSFLLCISKAASRHNCSSKLGKFCSRFAFAFTAKIISDARWWGGYKPPHRIYKWRDSCDTRRYETGLFEHKNALYLG